MIYNKDLICNFVKENRLGINVEGIHMLIIFSSYPNMSFYYKRNVIVIEYGDFVNTKEYIGDNHIRIVYTDIFYPNLDSLDELYLYYHYLLHNYSFLDIYGENCKYEAADGDMLDYLYHNPYRESYKNKNTEWKYIRDFQSYKETYNFLKQIFKLDREAYKKRSGNCERKLKHLLKNRCKELA